MENKKNRGELVVEASIVVTLVGIFITLLLYAGMMLYQKTLVSTLANQTAANIAQVYSNSIKDPFTGYVDPDKVYQSITYSNMKTDAYLEVLENKADAFAKYRLKASKILATGNPTVEVDIVKKPNELLKSQIVVTIHDKYDMPLVALFNGNTVVNFSASGRADCVDILEYINGVEAVGDPEDSNVTVLPDTKTCLITFIPDRNNPQSFTTVTVLKGKSILSSNRYNRAVMPANPTNSTYKFDGWVDENGRNFTAATVVENNIVVYGKWQCIVTLDAVGGKVNSKDIEKINVSIGGRAYLPNATRNGYSFGGWFTEKNGKGTRFLSNDTIINKDVTLYANWTCKHKSDSGVSYYKPVSQTGNGGCSNCVIIYECSQCGHRYETKSTGKCSYTGWCGTIHKFRNPGNYSCEAPGYYTYHYWSQYGCITCQYCGKLRNRVVDDYGVARSDSLWCFNYVNGADHGWRNRNRTKTNRHDF